MPPVAELEAEPEEGRQRFPQHSAALQLVGRRRESASAMPGFGKCCYKTMRCCICHTAAFVSVGAQGSRNDHTALATEEEDAGEEAANDDRSVSSQRTMA